ncbi:hypothetical protein Ddye_019450 [Dipteronia dyeriana]|uniref:Apple domain-containing protein n=1 Tax=Dipteronia dyeriana TaxID=168575 RepID=A0AAD9TXY3_9ROSI|nr:hypothetical protein Ddye_019450 [Dipteronia dyeriana]
MARYTYGNDGFQLLVDNQADVVSFTYSFPNLPIFFALSSQGIYEGRYWNEGKKYWEVNFQSLQTECDVYGLCGAFGYCNPKKNPVCSCLRGFEPKDIEEWNSGNWTSGCVRKRLLQCEKMNQTGDKVENDGFLKLETTKLPVFAARSFVSIEKCRELCLNNCSCIAYAYDSGLRCMTWVGSLIDIQKLSSGAGDLYIRLAHSELEKRNTKVLIILPVVGGIITIAICAFFLQRWMSKRYALKERSKVLQLDKGEADTTASGENLNEVKLHDLPLFNFLKLANATDNFQSANKLGQGGFGPVYKRFIDMTMFTFRAWKLWNKNNIVDLIDPVISNPYFQSEISRCIHVGLLCVQEFVKDRPTMSTVISMLNSEIVDLPNPKQPAFTERRNSGEESSEQSQKRCSRNYVTVVTEGQ